MTVIKGERVCLLERGEDFIGVFTASNVDIDIYRVNLCHDWLYPDD